MSVMVMDLIMSAGMVNMYVIAQNVLQKQALLKFHIHHMMLLVASNLI